MVAKFVGREIHTMMEITMMMTDCTTCRYATLETARVARAVVGAALLLSSRFGVKEGFDLTGCV